MRSFIADTSGKSLPRISAWIESVRDSKLLVIVAAHCGHKVTELRRAVPGLPDRYCLLLSDTSKMTA